MKSSLFLFIFTLFFSAYSLSAKNAAKNSIPLKDILAAYSSNTNERVIVDGDVKGNVQLYGFEASQVDYELLLAVLKIRSYTAYRTENYLAVIPVHQARIHVTDTLSDGDAYAPDQYVTDIIMLKNACAVDFMPLLKPIVHKYSFIEPSHSANAIVITDNYRNIKRIRALVGQLDTASQKQKTCEKPTLLPPRNKGG